MLVAQIANACQALVHACAALTLHGRLEGQFWGHRSMEGTEPRYTGGTVPGGSAAWHVHEEKPLCGAELSHMNAATSTAVRAKLHLAKEQNRWLVS